MIVVVCVVVETGSCWVVGHANVVAQWHTAVLRFLAQHVERVWVYRFRDLNYMLM